MTDDDLTKEYENNDPDYWLFLIPLVAIFALVAGGLWLFGGDSGSTPWPTITPISPITTPTLAPTWEPPSTNIPPRPTTQPTSTPTPEPKPTSKPPTATATPEPKPTFSPTSTPTPNLCRLDEDGRYTIQPRDSLWSISGRCLGNSFRWVEICRLNELSNCNLIHPGNRLIMPRG